MYKDSIRRFGAFFLLLTLWIGAVAVFPVNVAAQEGVKKDKKDKKVRKKRRKNADVFVKSAFGQRKSRNDRQTQDQRRLG